MLQIALMLYLIFDTGMFIAEVFSFRTAKLFHYVFSMLYYLVIPLPGLIFLLYCDFKVFNDENGLKRRLPFYLIPVIINGAAVLITPFTSLIFNIDDNNTYTRGDYFWITLIAGFGYLAAYPLLIIKTKRKKIIPPKGSDIYLYLFPIL